MRCLFVNRFFGFDDEWMEDAEPEEIGGRLRLPEDMDVAAEAILTAGDVERGFVVELVEREWPRGPEA